MKTINLDANATTKPADEVVDAMMEALREFWHNPSSVHRSGQTARQKVELARESICRLIGCRDRELIFTSGGTESANLAIRGSLKAQPKRNVLITARTEHSTVRESAEALAESGVEVVWISCSTEGLIDLNELENILASRADEIVLVSIMWSNNETGVMQPVEFIGELCHQHGVRFHTDATQWVGKMPLDVSNLPVDLLTFSAHKFHGPKGVGGLFVRRGIRLGAQIIGGPQERQRRGGTENVPGIIGMGVAAELAMKFLQTDVRKILASLRDDFQQRILEEVDDAVINGAGAPRIWNTTNIGFSRLEAEAILLLLSERGVCASAGAACSSGSLDPSPVLLAMNVPREIAHGSIRFSLSRDTTAEELDEAVDILITVQSRLHASLSAI